MYQLKASFAIDGMEGRKAVFFLTVDSKILAGVENYRDSVTMLKPEEGVKTLLTTKQFGKCFFYSSKKFAFKNCTIRTSYIVSFGLKVLSSIIKQCSIIKSYCVSFKPVHLLIVAERASRRGLEE